MDRSNSRGIFVIYLMEIQISGFQTRTPFSAVNYLVDHFDVPKSKFQLIHF